MKHCLLHAALAVAALSATSPAQASPQIHECVSTNQFSNVISQRFAAGKWFAHEVIAPQALTVSGFDFLMSNPTTVSVNTALYLGSPSGGPASAPVQTSTTVVSNHNFYCPTVFAKTTKILAGQRFYLAYQVPSDGLLNPECSPGTFGTYYFSDGVSAWNGPWTTHRFSWRVWCDEPAEIVPYGCALGSACDGTNQSQTANLSTAFGNGQYAFGPFTATSATEVHAFSFLCSHSATEATVDTFLYLATAADTPDAAPVRQSKMRVGTSSAFYETCFSPLILSAGRKYFLALTVPDTGLKLSAAGGTITPFFVAGGTSNWAGPKMTAPFATKVWCANQCTSAALVGSGVPGIGGSFTIALANARPSTNAGLFLGASRRSWGAFALPLDLAIVGAPGCSLLTSFDVQLGVLGTGAGGSASQSLAIPLNTQLLGGSLYYQWWIAEPGKNALGVTFSNAAAVLVGG